MSLSIIFLVVLVFVLRLYFLKISKQNERTIVANGGVEYGVKVTKLLTLAHIAFYAACVCEAVLSGAKFDTLSAIGFVLLIFAFGMLYFIVFSLLRGIWTVKLMIAKDHKYNSHWLFERVKHPNYYLNIAPELLGLAMLCHAKFSFVFLVPIYAFVLFLRIKEENTLIKNVIKSNGTL